MAGNYLHKNLRFLRKKNKWKQAEMKDRCGISPNTWSNYENNVSRPGLEKLIELSKIFGININDLLLTDLENGVLKDALPAEDSLQSTVNEEDNLTAWVILGQLKQIDKKIDQLLSVQNKRDKQDQ
ncbi:MAG TPA: helix-turn-helix transcriptional regulator [Agriterribacter sp.]|nr:helix-turn-helix transcriptional regulator [Agriterribacter sp.]HRQ51133.1 helix-turn-helix transcriptional regulator [Agriterribacter sp.]